MGGIDWTAVVDLFAPMYGVDDLDGLIERLLVIKQYQPNSEGSA